MALEQNDGKINVNINKPYTGELVPQDFGSPRIEAADIEKPSVQSKAITAALIQAGQQAIQQGIDAHAQLSGNYVTANAISNISTLGTDALAMATGGPVGVIMVGTKYALKAYQAYTDSIVANRQIAYDNKRLGQISREGSRYW